MARTRVSGVGSVGGLGRLGELPAGVADHEAPVDHREHRVQQEEHDEAGHDRTRVLTDGETPSLVCCRPCTIHGCRPFSVSSQPAVLMTNGSAATQTASRRNQPRPCRAVRARAASTPQSAKQEHEDARRRP